MNKVILMGRLTKDPDVTYTQGNEPMAVARYTLAVDRRFKSDGDQGADFIRCVAFKKNGEFAEKYLNKGKKIIIEGRIQTGSYENNKGETIYTTDIIVEHHEFAESKAASETNKPQAEPQPQPDNDGFVEVPDDDGLPF